LKEDIPLGLTRKRKRMMTLDAAETVLGFFGFDRTVYDNFKRNNERSKWRWYEELKEQRVRDMKQML
jgi:hypothetical protein